MKTQTGVSILAVLANTHFHRVNEPVCVGIGSACSFPQGLRRHDLNRVVYFDFATRILPLTVPFCQAIGHFSSASSGLTKPRALFNTHSRAILPAV
jgi:hypothetical protein